MNEVTDFPPLRRWHSLALIVLTVMLHLVVLYWSAPYLTITRADEEAKSAVSVVLHPLPPPEQPVSLPTAQRPPPSSSQKKSAKSRNSPTPLPAPVVQNNNTVTSTQDLADAIVTSVNDEHSDKNNASDNLENTPINATNSAAPPQPDSALAPAQGTHYQVDPPPSAQLIYEVLGTYNNLTVRGSSSIAWQTDGKKFTIEGITEDFFFTFLSFNSRGDINAFGIAPELYTEKKIRRAATNTHFNRERNLISFSASTTSYPLVGGEQDRASLIWQLAAIGRGDSSKFAPGATIDLFVAGVRDGEVWRMQIVGQEEMQLPAGKMQVWHVVRQPRAGSYDQQLDIWFAPDLEWYPVRLRFTETNGDYLDLSLSKRKNL